MNKKKILTVVGTRPEIIRLSSIIKKLENHFDHHLVHTNQNYDYHLKDIFLKEFKIQPRYTFETISQNPIENISKIILKVDQLIKRIKPDGFLILGDTNNEKLDRIRLRGLFEIDDKYVDNEYIKFIENIKNNNIKNLPLYEIEKFDKFLQEKKNVVIERVVETKIKGNNEKV